jgi:phosphatidylinositol alpha 1,6-mannosyltransferase
MVQRIAIVTESFLPQINGVTNSVIRVLESIKQNELEAIVIAPNSESELHLGFPVIGCGSVPVMNFAVGIPGKEVATALAQFGPDVIHVAAPFMLGSQAITWGKENSVPTVAVYQTDVAGYLARYKLAFAKHAMERALVAIHENATLNLAPTELSARYLRTLGLGSVKVWGRGVDTDLYNPGRQLSSEAIEIRNKLAPNDELIVGFVGRLAAEKQVHRMSELFGIEGVRFVVVGDGPERKKLEKQFGQSPVTFTGMLRGLELANTYAAMDVFVHFGTEETFGQTIQEAQASGLAVIAPNSGGPSEIVEDGVNGILINPSDALGYRLALESLIATPGAITAFGKRAAKSVQGRSWKANNDKLLDYYLEAISILKSKQEAARELA